MSTTYIESLIRPAFFCEVISDFIILDTFDAYVQQVMG
jgi:hypothetical protein